MLNFIIKNTSPKTITSSYLILWLYKTNVWFKSERYQIETTKVYNFTHDLNSPDAQIL